MKTLFTFVLVLSILINTQAQTITYTGATASICAGGQIVLTASNPPIPTGTFLWQFSLDGFTNWISLASSTANLVAVQQGFYRVTVSGPPIFVYPSLQVTENANPVANFTHNATNQCGSVPVLFNNSSVGATNYFWNFADIPSGANNTSILANPTHQFVGLPGNATQTFAVSLTAYNAQGCENTTSTIITINQLPDASLNGTGYSFANGVHSFKKCANSGTDNFSFNNLSSTIATNTNYQIIWGDGTPDFTATTMPTTQILTHTYSQGVTNLLFIVTGANGCIDTTAYTVFLGSNPAVGFGNPGNTAICAPSTLTFPISNTANNNIGTTYLVTFNDGTPPINFTHPPPASISHTFNYTSCGTNSPPNFPNSFSATILATNPCAQSLATVVPIYVSEKPRPSFDLSPNDTICLSNLLNVTNTSGLNSSNDNGSCTPGKVVWSITPATGWVLNSGNFGNLNGTLDPGFWTSGTQNLNFSFTTVGTYTIKMIIGNTFCGIDSLVKTVCVNPIPIAAFSINNMAGCSPVNVNTANSSNTPFCGNNLYNWVVSYAPSAGCAANASNFNYLNGTNNTSENPQYSFINPGVYTISLQTTSPGGTCISSIVNRVVTVRDKPVVSINTLPPLCENQTAAPTAATSCFINAATTYLWSFNGASINSSTNAIPGTLTYTTAGNYTLALQVTNECGITNAAQTIAVYPQPDFVAPNNIGLCAGSPTPNYNFVSTPSGGIFSWTNTNTAIGLAASGMGNIPSFIALNNTAVPQVATINVTVGNGSCVKVKSYTITVNPAPATPTTNTPVPYCQNATAVPLIATALVGHTLLWYSTATGGVGSATAPTPSTSIAGSFTFYVSQTSTNTFNCESPRAAITVTVYPIPTVAGTSTSPTTCTSNNGTITLSGLLSNTTYTLFYTKNNTANTLTITTNNNGVYVLSGLSVGTYSNIYVQLNNCNSNIVGPFILTNPTPPITPTIAPINAICSGAAIALNASTSTNNVTYSWAGPNGFSSSLQSPIINNSTVANAGAYTVTATSAGCVSAQVSINVVVHQTPATPTTSSNTPLCTGATLLLFGNTATPGSMNYAWVGPNSFTSQTQNPTIANAAITNAGQYTLVVTSVIGNCVSPPSSTMVVINPTPVITNSTSNNPTGCATSNGSITLSGLLPNTLYTLYYTNNAGAAISTNVTTNPNGVLQLLNLAAGMYSNFFVVLQNCTSNNVGPFTLTNPPPPATPVANNNSPLCVGTMLQLAATTTTPGIATYSWVGPNGFTSVLQNPTIANVTAANAGLYNVTVTINNCASQIGSVNLTVNPTAGLPTVISPINYCVNNNTVALTATANSGHSLYWYNTATGGQPLTAAPIPTANAVGTTTYYVSQSTALGCQGLRVPIEVKINPNARALFTPTEIIKCAPFVITPAIIGLQQFPQLNSSYEWYANNVLIGTSIVFPGYTITNQNDSVKIKLKTTSIFACKADSLIIQFNTFQIPEPSFTQSLNIGCGALQVSFTNTTPLLNQYVYNWNFGNGTTSTAQQPVPVTFAPNPNYNDTTYNVRLSVSSVCNTMLFERPVTVKSKPKALFTPNRTTGCSPMLVIFANTSKGVNNTYYWEFDDGTPTFITTSLAGFSHTFNTGVVRNYNIRLIATNDCGSDTATRILTVAPNNIQLLYAINGPDRYGCAPHTVAFFNSSTGASSFQWNFGDGNTLATTQNVQTVYHTYQTAGDYTVSLTAANNCTDTFALRQITVYPKPTAAFTTSTTAVCIGQTVQMNNTSSSGTSYLWNFGDNTTSTLANPTHTYNTASLTPYLIKLIIYRVNPSGDVCTDTTTRPITVNDTLPGNFSLSATTGTCAPFAVNFQNLIMPATTALWSFGDGSIGTGNTISHTYTQAGIFNVTLTVTAPGGCIYTKTTTVNVAGPTGTFDYAGGFKCYNTPVTFAANAANTNTYIWNFGDGITQTTTANIVTHNYANPGTYNPSVSLQNAGGCTIPLQGLAPVKVDKLTKGFTSSQVNSCGSTTVNFTDTSFAFFGKAQVKWLFGDGSTALGLSTSHSYAAPGTYTIKMVVIGNSGCTDTTQKNITVQPNSLPVANITAPNTGCAKDTISIISNVQSAQALNPLQWHIMPSNIILFGQNLNYVFGNAGTYTIKLIASNASGCADTALHVVTIQPSPNVVASNGSNICVGNTAQLTSTGATSYVWSPTNGLNCTTCPNPVATPANSIAYTVLGTNSFGCTNTDTVTLTVIQPTVIDASPNARICEGKTVNLLATGANNYIWNNANTLNNINIANPTAAPIVTTNYRVIGFDGYNCFADTAFVLVEVGKIPTVRLGADATLAAGTLFTLNTTITNGPIAQWSWTPTANLSCTNCPAPIATIKKAITYTVKVTTHFGCTASDAIGIKTFCESTQVFIPNAFTPDNDGLNDILMVRGKGIANVKYFRIFNRWGELIFEKNNFAANDVRFAWDGKIRGVVGPPDVFVYMAEVICESGESYLYKGNTSSIK